MKYVFLSDCYNHHQSSFSEAMYELTGGDYCFIATKPLSDMRKQLGWREGDYPDFVYKWFENDEKKILCEKIINEAEIVITGSAPENLLKERIKRKKLIVCYSERIYKDGYHFFTYPIRFFKYFVKYNHENMYLLCASAYSSKDYALTLNFINRSYKWGYFPPLKKYDIDLLMKRKNKQKISLLWVGRLIKWKHPEVPIEIVKRLKRDGYLFNMIIIGEGELNDQLKKLVLDYECNDSVQILDPVTQEDVRGYMETASIYIFSSDYNEGWGAVLNEAMNSGCAVVASHAIGAVPFLINHNDNGMIYHNGDIEDAYNCVKYLMDNSAERIRIGKKAYETISNAWNGKCAAKRVMQLIEDLMEKGYSNRFGDGPCSKAKILRNRWFR